ncbi:MAG: 3-keto-5-aminohexanoate cleavage protein [Gemmatimonadales bacterium]
MKFETDTPCVITAALTGGFARKEQLPWLPCSPPEIATAAIDCWKEGAAICHIHVRKPDGTPGHDKAWYEEIRDRVRAESDLNLNFTTSRLEGMTAEHRFEPVQCGPELATFNSGSLNFGDVFVFENSPTFMRRIAMEFWRHQVRPEFECFDTGHIGNIKRMIAEGYFEPPYFFQLVTLPNGTTPPRAGLILEVLKELPPNSHWMSVGAAKDQLPMNALGIIMGGHVRTGFEDNIYYRRGEKGKSNAQMVARVVRLCGELNRPVATAAQARTILGMRDAKNPTSKAYTRPFPAPAASGPVAAFFESVPRRLAGTSTPGLLSSYQFLLRGDGGGPWWVKIDGGTVTSGPGEIRDPSAYITATAADLLGVLDGTVPVVGAVMSGKILVSDGRFSGYGTFFAALGAGAEGR